MIKKDLSKIIFVVILLLLVAMPSISISTFSEEILDEIPLDYQTFPFNPSDNEYLEKKVQNNQGVWVDQINANVGDFVDYKITINSDSNDHMEDIIVYDYLPKGIDLIYSNPSPDSSFYQTFYDPSTDSYNVFNKIIWSFSHINPGETKVINLNTQIGDFPISDYYTYNGTNTAVLKAKIVSGGCHNLIKKINESDDAIVTVPRISIKKYVYNETNPDMYSVFSNWRKSATKNIGETFRFQIKVGNTGSIKLHNVIVEDLLPNFLQIISTTADMYPSYNIGNTYYWNLGHLDVGEVKIIEFSAQAIKTGIGENIANVMCLENLFSQDRVDVKVIDGCMPEIEVVKKANITQGSVGDLVNYEITVTNTGCADLFNVYVNDTTLDISFFIDVLSAKEEKIYNVHHELECCPDPFVNTVCVEGYDKSGKRYYDCDEEEVDIISGNIQVTKIGNISTGMPGEIVNYTITITNTGKDTLYDIFVNDINLDLSFNIDFLNSKESKIFYAKHILDCCENPFINVVNVKSYDILGKEYTDSDTWSVDVICQEPLKDLEIKKDVKYNCCGDYLDKINADIGDFVTFRINVSNTGDEPLDFSIIDELPKGLSYNDDITYDHQINNLYYWNFTNILPGEYVLVFFKADVVDCGYLINKATVIDSSEEINKFDKAIVNVECLQPNPEIKITKTANRSWGYVGDIVNYTIIVENIGDTILYDILIKDTTLDIEFDINSLDAGLDKTFYVEHILFEPFGLFENIVEVIAYDSEENPYTDSDNEFVEVRKKNNEPGLKIIKKVYDGSILVDELFVSDYPIDVRFNITLENIGNCDLSDIIIKDFLTCGLEDPRDFTIEADSIINYWITWEFDTVLKPNKKIYIEFTATAYKNTTNIVNATAFAQCTQEQLFDEDQCYINKGQIIIPDEKPTVQITSPISNSLYFKGSRIPIPLAKIIIIGGIEITAEAYDDNYIKRVEFFIDDQSNALSVDTNAPYNCTWDERIFGSHKIIAKAYDSNDQTAIDEIEVFIINFNFK